MNWRWSSAEKGRLAGHLAGQQAARQRYAHDHAHLARLRLAEEQLRRAVAEHVEDDLHRFDVRIFNRLERFLDLFHADAVVLNLPGLHQIVQRAEDFRAVEHLGRRAVELDQIERFGVQVRQAALDETGQVFGGIAVRDMRIEPPPGFRRHADCFGPLPEHLRDQALAVPVAVHVGGVDKVHAQVDCAVERGNRLAIVHAAPRAANRPRAKADFRHHP